MFSWRGNLCSFWGLSWWKMDGTIVHLNTFSCFSNEWSEFEKPFCSKEYLKVLEHLLFSIIVIYVGTLVFTDWKYMNTINISKYILQNTDFKIFVFLEKRYLHSRLTALFTYVRSKLFARLVCVNILFSINALFDKLLKSYQYLHYLHQVCF